MLVSVDVALFNDQQKHRGLDQFFIYLELSKHNLMLQDPEDANQILESGWLKDQPDRVLQSTTDLIKKLISNSVYIPKGSRREILRIEANLSLENANRLLGEPLYIFMENSTSDGAFLNSIARCFQKHGKRLIHAKSKGWVQFIQAGGFTQIVPLIQLYQHERAHSHNPRIIVILDSNKTHQLDEKADVKVVTEFCAQNNIPFHCLFKREIENYLPINSLSSYFEKEFFEAFNALSPSQMDFYDLDKGFNNKAKPHDDQVELFSNISATTLQVLRKGCGLEKGELYKLFEKNEITRERLLARCSHQAQPLELKDILQKIEAEL